MSTDAHRDEANDVTAPAARAERNARGASERGWGPASVENSPEPARGDGVQPGAGRPPSASERGWGPASVEKYPAGGGMGAAGIFERL